MDIQSVELKLFQKQDMHLCGQDGLHHAKVLPRLSLVQAVEGNYDIALDTALPQTTGEGGFFIAPSGVQQNIVHRQNAQTGQMRCRWIFIDVMLNNAYRLDFVYAFPTVLPPSLQPQMNALFDRLFAAEHVCDEYACYYEIVKLLLSTATEKQGRSHRALQEVLTYITNHLAENIRIEDLAQQAHMSSSNLYAVFKKQFGVSPIAYINNARLSLAAEHLLSSDDSIASVAAKVGFGDPFYFSKLFHRAYSMSPRRYRDTYRFARK